LVRDLGKEEDDVQATLKLTEDKCWSGNNWHSRMLSEAASVKSCYC
jgi:hypothetical protein